MEKNENEELLEQSPAEIQQEDTPEIAKSGKEEPDTEEQKVSNGRFDHIAETVVFFTGTADDVYHLFIFSPAG